MPDRARLRVYTIPVHRAFADALATGLIRQHGGEPLALARGTILVPNHRARRAITDAFVRASGSGLLLPRIVAIGDPELDEAAGAMFDPADAADPVPPAVDPLARRLILSRLIEAERAAAGAPVDAAEALRLAGDLARTLDQLLVEDVTPRALAALELAEQPSEHWQRALEVFRILLDRWPAELARLGCIDLAERRSRLMRRAADRWRAGTSAGFICAAGVTSAAPSVARLLRRVAELPQGLVVLPGVATDMPDDQWDALGPHPRDAVTGKRPPSIETHPQFHLKLVLDRMGVARGEVMAWRHGSDHDAAPARGKAIATALAPAQFTYGWNEVPARERRLTGVAMLAVATPAEEAQAIAIALREALEAPGRTAALVTPDRALAIRVAAHCRRWGIAIDDSAGAPLSTLAPGTLLLAIAEAAAAGFAPVPLLALLKHPLVRSGDARIEWLDGVRSLDLALRGPRPAAGLEGIARYLSDPDAADAHRRRPAIAFWKHAEALLRPIAAIFGRDAASLVDLVAVLRESADALAGDAAWARQEGRAAADLLAGLEANAAHGPARIAPAALPVMLRTLMDEIAIRPPQGGHPRLAIYGLLEARLQTADLMVLGGLNEGVWPGLPAPDPWLAPRIRSELGLPGLERRIGLSAHDLAGAMGARDVLMTRAERDASAPTIASRFWLRLQALAGEQLHAADDLARWCADIDDPREHAPSAQPAPRPPVTARPRIISVTEVDRLKADPFAFYARRMLKLTPLDPVDADASAAWRGTAIHAVFERWAREDRDRPERLADHALALMRDDRTHPLMRALWQPRLMEAVDWIASQLVELRAGGRQLIDVEREGRIEIAGVTLKGKYDRIDRNADGTLAIVDYKSGQPPSTRAVREGFSLQLGLLGLIAERGGFEGIQGTATAFEYWSLARNRQGGFGFVASPVDPKRKDPIPANRFVEIAAHNFIEATAAWLTGDAPFTAKLNPLYAPYGDYDQLMRRDEWWGRE
ncbi:MULTISPECIES: double-strand break repair protein AddB [unclassified Sphingomonas]|uniref:double-strand break repair protein AddB n=1 Tax=unclassified Sphingomonas TaxID=196159 RepID=UPI00082CBF18|nr:MULTISPECIES: double-strand break repair protein AddB [unclassified Sphingomonas]